MFLAMARWCSNAKANIASKLALSINPFLSFWNQPIFELGLEASKCSGKKSKFSYNGKLNFKPFHSYLVGSATAIDFSHLFSANAITKQLLKTEILNNKNIDFKLNYFYRKLHL